MTLRWLGQSGLSLASSFGLLSLTATSLLAEDGGKAEQGAGTGLAWFLTLFVIGLTLLGLMTVRRSLLASNWSISEALSEPTETNEQDASGKTVESLTMRASSSRLIALLGLIVILALFLGFGLVILFDVANTGKVQLPVTDMRDYLLAGLTLFAPYTVNKIAAAVKN